MNQQDQPLLFQITEELRNRDRKADGAPHIPYLIPLPGVALQAALLCVKGGDISIRLLGAFFKRRLKMKPGSPFPIVDQLDFVLGGLLLGSFLFPISWTAILVVVLVTPPIHLGTNLGAHALGLKKTYW